MVNIQIKIMLEEQVKEKLKANNISWEKFQNWMTGRTYTIDAKNRAWYHPSDVSYFIQKMILLGEEKLYFGGFDPFTPTVAHQQD